MAKPTHVDDDPALEYAVRRVGDHVALLLETGRALRLVADGGVHVLPLVLGGKSRGEHVAVRARLQEVDLSKKTTEAKRKPRRNEIEK